MATLTNRNINETYFGLLKTNDNEVINGLTRVTDGLGCNSSISINCGDGSSNALCVHGNLTFDTLCDFNFPQAGSSTNEIFIVNNCNITLGNANDTLQNQFTFTGGVSTFEYPFDLTLNDKGVVEGISTQSKPASGIAGSGFLINTLYQNTSDKKILVTAIIDGGNDIFGFAAHVGENSSDVSSGGSGRDANGRDKYTCKAYEYHVSDGSTDDATTLIFVVPPGEYFRMTGDATIIRALSYELN